MNMLRTIMRVQAIVEIAAIAALTIGAIAMISGMSACACETSSKTHGKTEIGDASASQTIVCIGDSITFGMGVANPARDAWPTLLQGKLGDGWSVVNLGVSGTTLLDEAGNPYRATGNVERACKLDADMAIIMLGTNDSVDPAWNAHAYSTQLAALIDELAEASSHDVRFVLMAPPCTFFGPDDPRQRGTMNQIVGGEMREIVRQTAFEKDARYIDLYAFTENHPEWFPDDLHPNEAGNAAMADYIYARLFA